MKTLTNTPIVDADEVVYTPEDIGLLIKAAAESGYEDPILYTYNSILGICPKLDAGDQFEILIYVDTATENRSAKEYAASYDIYEDMYLEDVVEHFQW